MKRNVLGLRLQGHTNELDITLRRSSEYGLAMVDQSFSKLSFDIAACAVVTERDTSCDLGSGWMFPFEMVAPFHKFEAPSISNLAQFSLLFSHLILVTRCLSWNLYMDLATVVRVLGSISPARA